MTVDKATNLAALVSAFFCSSLFLMSAAPMLVPV